MVNVNEIMKDNYKIVNSAFFNNGPMIAFVWRNDPYWSVEALSNNITHLLGYDGESFRTGDMKYADIIHPDDLPHVIHEVTTYSQSQLTSFTHKPYRVRHISGKYIWVDDATSIIYDTNNEITHYIGYITDCTDKIENILQLKNLKERWKLAWEGVNDGVWDWDLVNNKVYYSSKWKEMLGYAKNDLGDKPECFFNLIHPDDKEFVESILHKHFEDPEQNIYSAEIRLLTKDNDYKWILIRGQASLDENKTPVRMVGSHTDISQRKIDELKLLEQKHQLQTIFDVTKAGLALLDLDTNYIKVNKAYCEITGLTEDELLSTSCLALSENSDTESAQKKLTQLFEDGYVDSFEKTCMINTKRIIVNLSMTLLPDQNHILLSMKDITKFKVFEEQSKYAFMGEMIGNIAHQWRQPLSVISGTSSGIALKNELGLLDQKSLSEGMENIIDQVKYLSSTIDDFRNFLKNKDHVESIDIIKMIKKVYSLVSPALKDNHITCLLDLKDTLILNGFENELIQAFINFINNARDAIVENVEDDEAKVIIITTHKYENYLEITIQDSGGGIPESVMDKIYQPYFTTKDESIGTGIGLSMTYKIITEKHRGTIEVANKTFQHNNTELYGALFTIKLFEH